MCEEKSRKLEIYRQPELLAARETPARELTTDDYQRAILLKALLTGEKPPTLTVTERIRRWFQDPEPGLNA